MLALNDLIREWQSSGSSLSYGGWLERELRETREANCGKRGKRTAGNAGSGEGGAGTKESLVTPLERAEQLVTDWTGDNVTTHFIELCDRIQTAIIEATNSEVEKRRAAEAEVSRLHRIINKLSGQPDESPVPEKKIEFGENYVRLKIRHPHTGEWWEISATQEQPHLQGEVQRAD